MNFVYRLLFLSALLLIWASIDYRLKKAKGLHSERCTEYAFLYCSAAIACVFGIANDLITSWISPEYFIFGKGIAAGEGFLLRVCALGAQAGCSAGFIAAAVMLCCRRPHIKIFSFMKYIYIIIISAAITGCIARYALSPWISSDFLSTLKLSAEREVHFIQAWSIHIGLYAGLLLSLIVSCIYIRKATPSCAQNE